MLHHCTFPGWNGLRSMSVAPGPSSRQQHIFCSSIAFRLQAVESKPGINGHRPDFYHQVVNASVAEEVHVLRPIAERLKLTSNFGNYLSPRFGMKAIIN